MGDELYTLYANRTFVSDMGELRPEQALARSELENVDEIIMCGLSAFVMYRPSRQGETVREGGDLWAFDESKSVESLGVSGDGMLTLELRHASDMPQSGLQCVVSKVCLLYTSPSPRDGLLSRMPSSA